MFGKCALYGGLIVGQAVNLPYRAHFFVILFFHEEKADCGGV